MSVWTISPAATPESVSMPAQGAALWWLGQAGFLIRQGGLSIVIDAYLSDSLAEKYRGTKFPHQRMMAPPVAAEALRGIDWLLCTHAHTDHMDPGTIPALLAANPGARVLAPRACRDQALARGVPECRLVLMDAGETLDLGGVQVTATPAAHEDLRITPEGHLFLGYVLRGGGVTLWHSGDTIPFPGLIETLAPHRVDLALLPVNGRDAERAANGVPGNLTLDEAVALTDAIGARGMLGHHFGLFAFNTLDPDTGRARLAELRPAAEVALAGPGQVWHVAPTARRPLALLAICKGNICRSPLAEGLLRQHLAGRNVMIDSAALMDWNVGCSPDPRSVAVAAGQGIDISGQVARQIRESDFDDFDLILAMDAENIAGLAALAPAGARARILRLGDLLSPGISQDIQDPYEYGPEAFAEVFDQLDRAARIIAQNFIP
ncbi:Protein-tyrosine-phosphatase [Gemmobacter aquatilis]|uniref:protein-tyrosine-phosphatase n=1 Tax=Gemmobacter aquatilis TaxID=933059 RepID=A0A1H8MVT5_9RHOB|nr:MBL fold metallo-hydrolase [Gemmobacter aquatilis]SEO21467.1 Protein-tyrosine-phosphatase [Gemmobacter aquatilis]